MSLHVEVSGAGRPLVMLHGWGMHGGLWGDVVPRLAEAFEVHVVDLPGHGASGPQCSFTLDVVIDELMARFAQPVAVLGWSLGGIVALRWAACAPQQLERLALVASTPCFAARGDWPHGMPLATLQQFAAELERDYAATLRRFLALQLRGSENERELLGMLRAQLFSRGEPDMAALRGGLEILRDTDLRSVLVQLDMPLLAIAGERDKLTPPQAAHYLAQAIPNARAVEIAGAAHAPFLSHPKRFTEHLKKFLHE